MAILRKAAVVAFFFALVATLVVARYTFGRVASAQRLSGEQVPTFEIDPLWPKPLPNHWVLGQTIGVAVDGRDHIWIVHRGDASLNIMTEANNTSGPTWTITSDQPWLQLPGASRGGTGSGALSFSITGAAPTQPATGHLTVNVTGSTPLKEPPSGLLQGRPARARVRSGRQSRRPLGRSGTRVIDWPGANHGITVDYKDNVWIGGNDPKDAQVLKFTRDGKFLLQVGPPRQECRQQRHREFLARREGLRRSQDERGVRRRRLRQQARRRHRRRQRHVQALLGRLRQQAGRCATLGPFDPDAPPARQFRSPVHCAEVSNDGLVYVCDRANNRIQVFQRDGTFVNETFIARRTRGDGAVWDIAFSRDPEQKFLFVADGRNEKVYIVLRTHDGDPHELRRRRPPARPVLRRAQHCHRLARQRLHGRRRTKGSACRSSSTRAWDR